MAESRTTEILSIADDMKCIQGWRTSKVLGVGTVGTILLACKKRTECAAVKVQILGNRTEETSFKNELRNQKAFLPYAPEIYDWCITTKGKRKYGAIVMEILGDELDQWLAVKRSDKQLRDVGAQISTILSFMTDREITHGDLALFNMAFVKGTNRLILLDFDRASTKVFNSAVDYLRLHTELYHKTQSRNTKHTLESNLKVLRDYLPEWAGIAGVARPRTVTTADRLWQDEYEEYCVAANIKCLE